MTINPNGTVSIPYPPITDKANGEKVRADHTQSNFEALEEGINYQIDRYGKKNVMANINMGTHRLINLSTPISNGDATNKSYVDNSIANIPSSTTSVKGLIQIATNEEVELGENQNKAITPATLNKVIKNSIINANKSLPIDYLTGFECSNLLNNITILNGSCRDNTNSADLELTSPLIKNATLTWDEGNNEGGMSPNVTLTADTTYYILAIGTLPVEATNGKFTTPDISSNISNFQSISDGDLRVTVDGIQQNLTNLDFTGISDLNGIALVLNNSSLSGCSVSVLGNTIIFTSLTTGSTSTVNISGIPGGSGTDISLSNYLNASEGTITNGTNFIKSKVDIGFDTSETANNLLDISELPYTTGYRYYRKIGLFKTDSSNNIIICDETENKLTTSLNNITNYGLEVLTSYNIPIYTEGKDITSGYIAEKNGRIIMLSNWQFAFQFHIYVNSIEVGRCGDFGEYGDENNQYTINIDVKKGDAITWSILAGSIYSIKFYPFY